MDVKESFHTYHCIYLTMTTDLLLHWSGLVQLWLMAHDRTNGPSLFFFPLMFGLRTNEADLALFGQLHLRRASTWEWDKSENALTSSHKQVPCSMLNPVAENAQKWKA